MRHVVALHRQAGLADGRRHVLQATPPLHHKAAHRVVDEAGDDAAAAAFALQVLHGRRRGALAGEGRRQVVGLEV